MRDVNIAVIQFSPGPVKEDNLERAERMIRAAVRQGAEFVSLPELFAFLGADFAKGAEPLDGPTTATLRRLARELGVTIAGGSFIEESARPGRFHNTALIVGADGGVAATYRKMHTFDVDVPGVVTFQESKTIERGDEVVSVDVPFSRLGLSVCYDLRFPELYRRLADMGAEILLCPAAFSAGTGPAHWAPLLQARAIENQAFVVAADQCKTAPNGFRCHGHSLIIDPWGRVLAEGGEDEEILLATLKADELQRVRRDMPCARHRHPLLNPDLERTGACAAPAAE